MDLDAFKERDQVDMERLMAGEDVALNGLMERHATPLLHFLSRLLGNESEAADLAQETFVRVYQSRLRFRRGEKFTTWMYTIAANLGRNRLRWRSRHPTISIDTPDGDTEQSLQDFLPTAEATPSEQTETAERALAVRTAIAQLPLELREAILLCEYDDLPIADAAAILKATPKAIESRLYRARQSLRQILQKWLKS